MRLRVALLLAVLAQACTVPGLRGQILGESTLAWRQKIDSLRTDALEGIWEINGNPSGGLIAITGTPGLPGVFDVTLLESPDWRTPAGTPCGRATAGSSSGSYDATLRAAYSPAGRGAQDVRVLMELSEDGQTLTFRPYRKGLRLSLRRMLPYLFGVSVRSENTRPDGALDGARRLWPPAARNISL